MLSREPLASLITFFRTSLKKDITTVNECHILFITKLNPANQVEKNKVPKHAHLAV